MQVFLVFHEFFVTHVVELIYQRLRVDLLFQAILDDLVEYGARDVLRERLPAFLPYEFVVFRSESEENGEYP